MNLIKGLFLSLKKFYSNDYKFYRLKQTIILLLIISFCFLMIKLLSISISSLIIQYSISLSSSLVLSLINIQSVNPEYFVMIFSGSLTILVLSFSLSQFMIERLSNSFSLKLLDEYENNILIYCFYNVQILSVIFNLMIIICSLDNIITLIISLIIFLIGLYLLIDYINTIYYFSNPKNMINRIIKEIEEDIIKFDYNNLENSGLNDDNLLEKWKKSFDVLNEKFDLINDFLNLYLNRGEYLFVNQIYDFMHNLIKNEVGRFQIPSFLSNYLIIKYFDICYMIISYDNIDFGYVEKIENDLHYCFGIQSFRNTKRLFFDSMYNLSIYYEMNKHGSVLPNGKYFLRLYELNLNKGFERILFEYSLNNIKITEDYFFNSIHDYVFTMNAINLKYKRFDLFNKSIIDNKHFISEKEGFIEIFVNDYDIDYENLGHMDYYNNLINDYCKNNSFINDLNLFIKYSSILKEYMVLSRYLLYQIYLNDLDYKKYFEYTISIIDNQLNFLIGFNESNSHTISSSNLGYYSLEFLYVSYILTFLLVKETKFNSNEYNKLIITRWLNIENQLITFIKKCDDFYLGIFYEYLPYNENIRDHIIRMFKNKNNKLKKQIYNEDY